jgi:hypothetical protein
MVKKKLREGGGKKSWQRFAAARVAHPMLHSCVEYVTNLPFVA